MCLPIIATLGVSIFLALFAEGSVISGADVRYLFGKPPRLLAVLVNQFAVVPYKLWRKRVHAAVSTVSPAAAHSTSGPRH